MYLFGIALIGTDPLASIAGRIEDFAREWCPSLVFKDFESRVLFAQIKQTFKGF